MQRALVLILVILSLAPAPAAASALSTQEVREASPDSTAERWAPLAFLIGDWEGVGSGKPGESIGRFSLSPDLQGHVLVRRNTADTPSGRHEDLMLIYPSSDHGFRAVYTDNEDHVINYAVTTTESPKSAVFLSDEAPGVPRFRLTYRLNTDGTVGIVFEIAPPGSKELKTYTEGVVRKRRSPA